MDLESAARDVHALPGLVVLVSVPLVVTILSLARLSTSLVLGGGGGGDGPEINARAIGDDSFACIEAACGPVLAEVVFSSVADICSSVTLGHHTLPASLPASPPTTPTSSTSCGSNAGASNSSNGSDGPSSSGGSNDHAFGSNGSSSSQSGSSSLSAGAIAGGAVLCTVLYWLCRN
ncbi:hypothetical protein O9K51_04628 [Purpureocillium lavendulum]|uniref:Uncharacterized protein n=1 Tax=Purpureocillium lavendulum TaxID=1247861 RepID=A0AB34FX36_9HYPO|nr:hypothetical protein O9K51_04628 [Purpureocillium lavendulum]